MLPEISRIKGVHPGAILRRELKNQDLKSSELASHINEYRQTLSAVLNKRRHINAKLSIKLAKYFNVSEDYFLLLQASYDVKIELEKEMKRIPNVSKFRKVIFWDTTIDKIDWDKNKNAVIKRILERGNEDEINEIVSFYGKKTISIVIKEIKGRCLPSYEKNISKYNLK